LFHLLVLMLVLDPRVGSRGTDPSVVWKLLRGFAERRGRLAGPDGESYMYDARGRLARR